jgi:hypothetical protein
MVTLKDEMRMWKSIETNGRDPENCWLWKGNTVDKDNYGLIKMKGSLVRTHRVVLSIKIGRPLEKGEIAMHLCNNPLCNNPAHLKVGTQKENMQHMVTSGRSLKGAKNPRAKINEEIARTIKELHKNGITPSQIMQQLNLTKGIVEPIIYGISWKHI